MHMKGLSIGVEGTSVFHICSIAALFYYNCCDDDDDDGRVCLFVRLWSTLGCIFRCERCYTNKVSFDLIWSELVTTWKNHYTKKYVRFCLAWHTPLSSYSKWGGIDSITGPPNSMVKALSGENSSWYITIIFLFLLFFLPEIIWTNLQTNWNL